MNMQEMEKIRDMFRGGDSTTVTTTLALNATAATALTTAIRDPATLTHRPPLQVHRDGDDREPHDDQPLAPPSPSSSHAIEEVGVDDDDGDVSMESRASSPTSPPFMLPAQPPPHSHKGGWIHVGLLSYLTSCWGSGHIINGYSMLFLVSTHPHLPVVFFSDGVDYLQKRMPAILEAEVCLKPLRTTWIRPCLSLNAWCVCSSLKH